VNASAAKSGYLAGLEVAPKHYAMIEGEWDVKKEWFLNVGWLNNCH